MVLIERSSRWGNRAVLGGCITNCNGQCLFRSAIKGKRQNACSNCLRCEVLFFNCCRASRDSIIAPKNKRGATVFNTTQQVSFQIHRRRNIFIARGRHVFIEGSCCRRNRAYSFYICNRYIIKIQVRWRQIIPVFP